MGPLGADVLSRSGKYAMRVGWEGLFYTSDMTLWGGLHENTALRIYFLHAAGSLLNGMWPLVIAEVAAIVKSHARVLQVVQRRKREWTLHGKMSRAYTSLPMAWSRSPGCRRAQHPIRAWRKQKGGPEAALL